MRQLVNVNETTKWPGCGSLALASFPLRLHWRWEHRGSGDGLPWNTWCTARSCRWYKSTQGDGGGWHSSSSPTHSGAPPQCVPWTTPSRGVSEGAWNTATPHTSGKSSQPVTAHLYSGHRKPACSQAQPQTACPSAVRWLGNPRWCRRVWSFSAGNPHPDTPHGTLGNVAVFCPSCRQCQRSCRCRLDSSCGHRGEPLDQSRAEGRWGSLARRLAAPLAWTKTWLEDEVGRFFLLLAGYFFSLALLLSKPPTHLTSPPPFVLKLCLVSSSLRLFFPPGEATGESTMTTGNIGSIQSKQGSRLPLTIYHNERRCNHKCVQDSIPFQEALLSVLPGIHSTIGVAVDGKNMVHVTVLYTRSQNSFWKLESELSVKIPLYWKPLSMILTPGKSKLHIHILFPFW